MMAMKGPDAPELAETPDRTTAILPAGMACASRVSGR